MPWRLWYLGGVDPPECSQLVTCGCAGCIEWWDRVLDGEELTTPAELRRRAASGGRATANIDRLLRRARR